MKKKKRMGLLRQIIFVLAILFLWVIFSKSEGVVEERKVVVFTFDDGPDATYTPKVLQILKREKVKATFFCIGEKVEENPKLVKRIYKEGHSIGNHTYTHCNLCGVTKECARREIQQAGRAIEEIIGDGECYLLRAPFGKAKKTVIGDTYLHVGWNVDTLDWTGSTVDKIIRRVQKQLKAGGIILMHDQYPNTVEVLPIIIRWVRSQGYEIVSLEELLFGN